MTAGSRPSMMAAREVIYRGPVCSAHTASNSNVASVSDGLTKAMVLSVSMNCCTGVSSVRSVICQSFMNERAALAP